MEGLIFDGIIFIVGVLVGGAAVLLFTDRLNFHLQEVSGLREGECSRCSGPVLKPNHANSFVCIYCREKEIVS